MARPCAALAALLCIAVLSGGLPAGARVATSDNLPPRLVAPAARPPWLRAVTSAGQGKGQAAEAPGTYILVLDEPPLASYRGGLPGLAATSPAADRKTRRGLSAAPRLDVSAPAARAYLSHLARRQDDLVVRLAASLGRSLTPRARYRYALNGLSLELSPAEAAAAARLPGVRLVQRDEPRRLATDAGPALIGAAQPDLRPALLAAELDGQHAVPPTASEARGGAVLTYDATTRLVGVTLSYSGLSGAPTGAWVALAAPGQPGAVALELSPLAAPGGLLFAGELTLTDTAGLSVAQIEAGLLGGAAAVVIATAAAPAGEIRGRLRAVRGEGIIAGVIDGGINASNPPFADGGGDGYDHTNPRGAGSYLGVCAPTSGFTRSFPCNDKLIGAYTYPATAAAPDPAGRPSPFDDNGHGSHTASTLAGNLVLSTSVGGVATGPVIGVAPHASLVAYDVCGTPMGGYCPLEAIVAAIDQAAADGVDVANFSISGFPGDPWNDVDSLALLGALEAGVLTAVAASNDGPAPASIGSPANAPWVLTVGATTHGRRYLRTLGALSGGEAAPPDALSGAGFGTESLPPTPIVDAGGFPDRSGAPNEICLPFAGSADLSGSIVVCRQLLSPGSIAAYARQAGAAGLVIVWPDEVGAQIFLGPLPLPTVHLDAAAGERLRTWLAQGQGHMASISAAARDTGGQADSVAWFSSRGPNTLVPAVLRPDLVAPGLNILASTTDADPLTPDYGFLSGTSMAAPHAAGAAALLRQLHPGWTASEIRSALMGTALPELTAEDGATPATPHQAGAGRVQVRLAARAGLLLDEQAARFAAANPAAGGDPAQLNLASLSSPACLEVCVFTRTLRSALAAPASWTATGTGDAQLSLEVQPASFSIAPGATQTLSITARIARGAFSPDGSFLFGAVLLTEQSGLAPPLRLPAALNAPSAILPPAIVVRALTARGLDVTSELRTISSGALTLRVLGPSRGEPVSLQLGEDPTPADPLDGPPGSVSRAIPVPAGTPRVYLAIGATSAPDLDLFVFADGEGGPADGAAQEGELICLSAGYASAEACDLLLDGGAARQLIVIVQNYAGSGAAEDSAELLVNVTPLEPAGTMRAQGPQTVRAGERFSLTLDWELPDAPEAAGRYLGALQISSSPDPADAGDLGAIPLDLIYMRERAHLPFVGR